MEVKDKVQATLDKEMGLGASSQYTYIFLLKAESDLKKLNADEMLGVVTNVFTKYLDWINTYVPYIQIAVELSTIQRITLNYKVTETLVEDLYDYYRTNRLIGDLYRLEDEGKDNFVEAIMHGLRMTGKE